MSAKQERDKREFYEQALKAGDGADISHKIKQLDDKVHEFRQQEVKFLAKIKQLEEDLEGKDEEIDNLLSNLDNSDMIDQVVKLNGEKEELNKQIGSLR